MHAISIHDVASDTVHQFAPTYRDYVLYSDSNNPDDVKAPPKTFRAKTFVAIGSVSSPRSLVSRLQPALLALIPLTYPVQLRPDLSCLLQNKKTAGDGLLQNMEMGNAAQW